MTRIKASRQSITLDMTAMCDMAFLLLTFFMLATKFKPEESALVDIPSSVSEIKVPDSDIITISVQKDGAIFFGVDGQNTRRELIQKMDEKYDLALTEHEKGAFTLIDAYGAPVAGLRALLSLSYEQRQRMIMPGIPADSVSNELKDWVHLARLSNPKCRIAIKGDKDTDYNVIQQVVETLQKQNINKFNLITTLEM